MDPNQHKYSFQDQNQVSYSNQPSIPTEKQSFSVPQLVDQPPQLSQYVQPDQTIRKYIIMITPHNYLPSRYHSYYHENQLYSGEFIPDRMSYYVFQDQLGTIHLSSDLNKMLSLGKCLCIIAIMEILGCGLSLAMCFIENSLYFTIIPTIYMHLAIAFIKGYMKLDVNRSKCYYIIKRIINFFVIMAIVILLAYTFLSQTQNGEDKTFAIPIIFVGFLSV